MWKYVLKRLLLLIPVMLGTILVVFFIMDQSDVDPAKVMLGRCGYRRNHSAAA